MSMHRTATTAATIANGIKPTKHSIFEKRMMNVTAFVLSFKDGNRFLSTDPTGPGGMVFDDKTGKRFAHDQAYVDRRARLRAGHPARAVKNNNMVWILQNDVLCSRVRNNPFQVGQTNRLLHGDQLFCALQS